MSELINRYVVVYWNRYYPKECLKNIISVHKTEEEAKRKATAIQSVIEEWESQYEYCEVIDMLEFLNNFENEF